VNLVTGASQVAPPVAVFGQQMRRCDVHLATEFLMLRVHFLPGALFRMLNVPLGEFGEDYFDGELALGSEVREVSEQLAAARSYDAMVAIIEAYLLCLVAGAKNVLPIDRAAAHLTADPLHSPLDWLARQACLSPRHFNRKFTERVGVGPKLYGRLLRFHAAYLYKTVNPKVAWPAVALRFGYADYQHMVRDFRQFTNATPGVWLEADRASPEYLLADSGAA
jgi:AraC-like DNA-binding protein